MVADARGATVALEKPLALTVGKRLDRQAQSVRAVLAAARERAAEARGDASLSDEARAEIDATEQAAFDAARHEVYVGFHELVSLLPHAEPATDSTDAAATAAATAAAAATAGAAPAVAPAAAPAATLAATQSDNSVPPDLAEALGREGVQRMWECLSKHAEPSYEGEEWWKQGLPRFVRELLREHDSEKSRRERAEERAQDLRTAYDGMCEVNQKLLAELARAEGREEALHEVIDRCRWA